MRIKWDTIWLADDLSLQFASGLAFNGRQLVQEAQFMRAAVAAYYARLNRSVDLSFQVSRAFSTNSLAEQFFLSHYNTLVDGPATLTCRCGDGGEPITDILIQNAVLESVSAPTIRGTSVDVRYAFRAPKISAIYAPAADTDVRTFSFAIPSGVNTFVVTGLAAPSIPARVFGLTVRKPAGGLQLAASHVAGSITTDGFTVFLTGTTDSTGYFLDGGYSL